MLRNYISHWPGKWENPLTYSEHSKASFAYLIYFEITAGSSDMNTRLSLVLLTTLLQLGRCWETFGKNCDMIGLYEEKFNVDGLSIVSTFARLHLYNGHSTPSTLSRVLSFSSYLFMLFLRSSFRSSIMKGSLAAFTCPCPIHSSPHWPQTQ